MSLLLGLDLGTSYFKVALFDFAGNLRGLGRVAVEKISPVPGRFELPAPKFWELLRKALEAALTAAGARVSEITAVSYSSQASTFLLLDGADEPLTPLIFWNDTRGESMVAEASFSRTEEFRRRVGFSGVSGQTAACKWLWFQRNKPDLWRRARRIMTISDYFTFAMTGERAGDAGTAAFLGIYDLPARGWWPAALDMFGIPAQHLSSPLRPGSPCGQTVSRATAMLGVPAGLPFAVGSLDHHVAALGAGLGAFADVSISTGTVLAALAVVEKFNPQVGCYFGLHTENQRYYCLAFDQKGATQIEEYQRDFAPTLSVAELLALAEAHHSGRTNNPHGARVLDRLESISETLKSLVSSVSGGRSIQRIVATGGGSRSPLWLQIKADTLGVPVTTSSDPEQGCLGAAVFAAAAAKIYPTMKEAFSAMVHRGETYEPSALR